MHEIRVERTLNAPADHVFALITDHEGYTRFEGITSAKVVRQGDAEPDGLGAQRSLKASFIRFDEEIVAFERPTRMDYKIYETNLPIEHERGSIQMTPNGERTDVLWVSTFEATPPVIGKVVGAVLAKALDRSFNRMLSVIEAEYRPGAQT